MYQNYMVILYGNIEAYIEHNTNVKNKTNDII